MTIGINDNIAAIYRAQQIMKSNAQSQNIKNEVVIDSANEPSKAQKISAGVGAFVGVASSLALLAKCSKGAKYSLNPLKIVKSNILNSYVAKAEYKTAQIVTMGAGSIIGGLIGGSLFDDKKNFNSKVREGIVQIANISFPIAFVEALSYCGTALSRKLMPNWSKSANILKQAATKLPSALGAAAGLITGMYIGNRCSNKFNEKVFNKKDNRPMKWKDFSAHVDDIAVAATFVAPENVVTKGISRLIPLALLVAGYETGTKKEVH